MPKTQPPLSSILPPLICGTATFNNLYNDDAFALPTTAIVQKALALGVNAFDTSPYYGPSEELLGKALNTDYVRANHPRGSYYLVTKVGRIAGSEFDYSAEWVRYSIQRSLQRLHTKYLDVVYCHDVEFVTAAEVLTAVRELRRIRDTEGTVKYIGISGYPVPLLCDLAELVLKETGEPLDCVMSYANFTLQNTTLETVGLERLLKAGVSVVPNASPLGMGLLRGAGVPIGAKGDFHPAPQELRDAVQKCVKYVETRGERLEVVAIRWALETWAVAGARVGGKGGVGISVMGVSNLAELEETMRVWGSVVDGLELQDAPTPSLKDKSFSLQRRAKIQHMATEIWKVFGTWRDYTWASPDVDYVNVRTVKGVIDQIDQATPRPVAGDALFRASKSSRL
ncbi:L-galactose dehydrogenase [Phlyctema vagabunda]|uniref:L-galactose dehydrogenase n=1 Tax=Phlyctema vagabunda TaxID=108571 RepID=A0ABR4PLP7_9HELO